MKCINPTNLFTIAGFHYSEGHVIGGKKPELPVSLKGTAWVKSLIRSLPHSPTIVAKSNLPFKMPPQRRFARTPLEKWKICQARLKSGQRSGEMTLEDFCKLFLNPDGKPMPLSSMSMILRKTDIAEPPEGASAIKMKERSQQFPIFERVLVEWIEKALMAKVLISDEVIKEQGRILI